MSLRPAPLCSPSRRHRGLLFLHTYCRRPPHRLRPPRRRSAACSTRTLSAPRRDCVDDNGWLAREVDMSGFGNGQFEMTTASNANSFVATPPAGSCLTYSVEDPRRRGVQHQRVQRHAGRGVYGGGE
ncbi:hypothetical protein C8J57DRAFT_454320 [Mycena rebaudengoi]|nr:hypothetical protein C8J57DRAFT_454320 [Mycena rebaudengoi]